MKEKIANILRQFTWIDWLLLGGFCAGLIYLVLFGLSLWWRTPKQSVEYLAVSQPGSNEEKVGKIWVDVAGAVTNPGVYQLPGGARIKDALVAAGGLTDKADRQFVEQAVNLAGKVQDGDKIYIPPRKESGGGSTQSVLDMVNGMINLNQASKSELMSLSGIGEVRAQAIIDNRPYGSTEDLVKRAVLSATLFAKIRDKITVY